MTSRDDLDRYLSSREVPASAHPAILDRAGGHWLLTRLLADLILADPAVDLAHLPGSVNEAYAKLLDQARPPGASNPTILQALGLLALAGEGPVLPLSLLARACQTLGGPEGLQGVRDVLDRLDGLVVRRDAGTNEEHAGLFHDTLAEYLFDPSAAGAGFPPDARAMHEAMIQAIDALAATARHGCDDPVHRYAMFREAEHLWAIGNAERTLASLRSRGLVEPRENLRRWLQWLRRFGEQFDEDNPNILDLRGSIVFWTSRSGNSQEALRLCAELLQEQERVLGRDQPITLLTPLPFRGHASGKWATGGTQFGCSPSSCRTRSERWAATTLTHSKRGATSHTGPPGSAAGRGLAAIRRAAARHGARAGR